jgi:hypothetical protein
MPRKRFTTEQMTAKLREASSRGRAYTHRSFSS